jgi:5-methylcytosine-specific restriction endonuclease McrA
MSRLSMHDRRHKIAHRDGWRCNFCDRFTSCATCLPEVPSEGTATVDHIVPKAQGGTDALANLCIACVPCNQAKADGVWPSPAERRRFVAAPVARFSPGQALRQANNRYTRKMAGRRRAS